ncbi:MAG: Ig-like domain-containing protein [Prevotella sp.]|nr:Ig-like domain-containing protein [Prevotella sp.]
MTSAGKVKGVKYGTAIITCTSVATGAKATCQVTVGNVVISMSEFAIQKGSTVTLSATVYPTTDKSVIWESSDTKVATVTSKGKVKGVKTGTAIITCTSNATGLSATCTVTVTSTSGSRSMEGADDELTGIEENVVAVESFDVYDLSGRKVLHQVTSLDGLPDGIYIVNGKKILKKK